MVISPISEHDIIFGWRCAAQASLTNQVFLGLEVCSPSFHRYLDSHLAQLTVYVSCRGSIPKSGAYGISKKTYYETYNKILFGIVGPFGMFYSYFSESFPCLKLTPSDFTSRTNRLREAAAGINGDEENKMQKEIFEMVGEFGLNAQIALHDWIQDLSEDTTMFGRAVFLFFLIYCHILLSKILGELS